MNAALPLPAETVTWHDAVVVDLETTGCDPLRDRITEVAVITLAAGQVVERWSTLINPGVGIPPEIQALTGITNAMVRKAPQFHELAAQLWARLQGRVLVAHNARFDYGFLKQSFARAGLAFTADVLCTVRLSRRLEPEHAKHNLDALVERHQLQTDARHRAIGDAELLVQLLMRLQDRHGGLAMQAAIQRILKMPSLPPQLPPDAIEKIPDEPGVYVFYGVNDGPLYIGKSIALRERVRSHFSNDYRTANDARISAEIQRIDFQVCAGEFSALLLEARWVQERFPAHNKALRKSEQWHCVDNQGRIVPLAQIPRVELSHYYGPFSSKRAAKAVLQAIAAQQGLCWTALGLEQRQGACFAHQVRKCKGFCVGAETKDVHDQRLLQALEEFSIPPWPFDGPGYVTEESAAAGREVHWFDQWCYVASEGLQTTHESRSLEGKAKPAHSFDPVIYRLVRRAYEQGQLVSGRNSKAKIYADN